MKDFLGSLLMAVLFIAALIGLHFIWHDNLDEERCLESQYKTRDYKISESNMLMCRSSDNSYQELKRVKPRSPHLDEHKRDRE